MYLQREEREGRTLAAHSREQLPTRSYSKTNRAQRAVTSAVVEKFSLGFRKAPAAIAVDPSYNTDPVVTKIQWFVVGLLNERSLDLKLRTRLRPTRPRSRRIPMLSAQGLTRGAICRTLARTALDGS